MKTIKIILLLNMFVALLMFSGCRRNTDAVWEDTKSASRHMGRGVRTLGGKQGDSRQINSRDEFMCAQAAQNNASFAGDFVPLSDDPNCQEVAMGDMVAPPPRETPGDPGSSVPGISSFLDPSTHAEWAHIFRNIHFAYNSSLIKGEDNLSTIRGIADYMVQHPGVYIFVEGHTDERGPDAYNLALGSHRANAVRSMLIGEGVNPDNIFSISYGKERPLVFGHGEESWQQNRRAEFKVFKR